MCLLDNNYSKYFAKFFLSYLDNNFLCDKLSNLGFDNFIGTDVDSTFKFINKLTVGYDYDLMGKIIDICKKKDYISFIKEILNSHEHYNRIVDKIKGLEIDRSISLINGCLFVVEDLDMFIKSLSVLSISANGGPQSKIAETSALNNFLDCLDIDFRRALYNHNKHHVDVGNIDKRLALPWGKFSYRNIHMKIGSVRYYSTKKKRC